MHYIRTEVRCIDFNDSSFMNKREQLTPQSGSENGHAESFHMHIEDKGKCAAWYGVMECT